MDQQQSSGLMGFWSHLEELKARLMRCLIGFLVGFVLCYFFTDKYVFEFLQRPLFNALPPDQHKLYFTSLFENFMTHLKIAGYSSLFMLCPFYFFQLWAFIAPGLHPKERKLVFPFIASASFFFVAGAAFAYYVLFPVGFKYFIAYGLPTDVPLLTIDAYYGTCLKLMLLFGFAFELPVLMVLLGFLGILQAEQLKVQRKNAIIGITVVSAFIAPPDAVSMLLLMGPLILMYEGARIVIGIFEKKRAPKVAPANDHYSPFWQLMHYSKHTQGTIALILVTAAWGLTFPLIKTSVENIAPFTFVALRFLIAIIFLGVGSRFSSALRPGQPSKGYPEWWAGVALGALLFTGYSLQTIGLKFTTASNASFITGLSVVIVPLITLCAGQKIRLFSGVGILLSTLGIGLLSLNSTFQIARGDWLILGCAASFAIHIFLVGRFSALYDPLRLTLLQIGTCAIFESIAAIALERNQFQLAQFTFSTIGSIFFCGIVATAIALLAQNLFQKYSTPVKTALIFTCEPVFGALFSAILVSEKLSAQQWSGGCLMVFAMLFAELGPQLRTAVKPNLS